ncbi:unnamed protein product [Natator depressus]
MGSCLPIWALPDCYIRLCFLPCSDPCSWTLILAQILGLTSNSDSCSNHVHLGPQCLKGQQLRGRLKFVCLSLKMLDPDLLLHLGMMGGAGGTRTFDCWTRIRIRITSQSGDLHFCLPWQQPMTGKESTGIILPHKSGEAEWQEKKEKQQSSAVLDRFQKNMVLSSLQVYHSLKFDFSTPIFPETSQACDI